MSILNLTIPKAYSDLFTPSRYKVYYGGRGGGKSVAVALTLIAMGIQKKTRILCTRELQTSIADSVHRLLSDLIRSHKLENEYEILQNTIRHKRNGTEFLFKGLRHNITEIKGLEGIDIVWAEEAENISNRSWELLVPTIRKEGSEIWVIFNPRNASDPTYQRFIATQRDDAIVRKVSWRDNPFFPTVLKKEMETLRTKDPESYNHIWEGELDTRRSGAIYAKLIDTARQDERVTKVPYDPSSEVFTAWDLGFGDATSIWWLQFVGRELRWLECYENSGEQLDHYVQVIKSKPYNYRMHYLPHDGAAGNIRGGTVSDQLRGMGIKNQVLDRESDINTGIQLLRQTIQYSVFDANKCKDGLHALENYRYEWSEELQRFKDKPLHDWSSNYADAARYAARAAALAKNMGGTKPISMQIPSSKVSFMGY